MSYLIYIYRLNRYDKREDLHPASPEMETFSHLLMEANATKMELLRDTHRPLAFVQGYDGIARHLFRLPPFSVRLASKTVLMQRTTFKESHWGVRWPAFSLHLLREAQVCCAIPKLWVSVIAVERLGVCGCLLKKIYIFIKTKLFEFILFLAFGYSYFIQKKWMQTKSRFEMKIKRRRFTVRKTFIYKRPQHLRGSSFNAQHLSNQVQIFL